MHDKQKARLRSSILVKWFRDVQGSLKSQLHNHAAIDGITLRYPECATSVDSGSSTKDDNFVDRPVGPKVIVL